MITEFIIVVFLVVSPAVIGVATGFKLDWEKSKCAYLSFKQARDQILRTQSRATVRLTCEDGLVEALTLLPLEDLDQDKGAIGFRDLEREASRSSAQFSSWRSALSARGSSKSDEQSPRELSDKSLSTGEPENSPST